MRPSFPVLIAAFAMPTPALPYPAGSHPASSHQGNGAPNEQRILTFGDSHRKYKHLPIPNQMAIQSIIEDALSKRQFGCDPKADIVVPFRAEGPDCYLKWGVSVVGFAPFGRGTTCILPTDRTEMMRAGDGACFIDIMVANFTREEGFPLGDVLTELELRELQ